jgi:hypothetical protein
MRSSVRASSTVINIDESGRISAALCQHTLLAAARSLRDRMGEIWRSRFGDGGVLIFPCATASTQDAPSPLASTLSDVIKMLSTCAAHDITRAAQPLSMRATLYTQLDRVPRYGVRAAAISNHRSARPTRADQQGDSVVAGEDANDLGASLDLADAALDGICRVQLLVNAWWEISFSRTRRSVSSISAAKFRHFRTQLVGYLTPLVLGQREQTQRR